MKSRVMLLISVSSMSYDPTVYVSLWVLNDHQIPTILKGLEEKIHLTGVYINIIKSTASSEEFLMDSFCSNKEEEDEWVVYENTEKYKELVYSWDCEV